MNGMTSIDRALHSEREQIPDVPAVYFISPTQDNVKRIGNVRLYLHCVPQFEV
jgi:hypothetical protein